MAEDNYGVNPSTSRERRLTGIVSEKKSADSKILKVFINELTPVESGKLEAKTKNYATSGGTGGHSGSTTAANHVIAHYKGDSANRRYCPDVVEGEEVIVYTDVSNSSIWYWEATNKDKKQRTDGERVGEIANNAQNPEDLNEENTYGWEANTKGKYFKIYTSKSNGEKFQYNILIDAGHGKLQICDDDENRIEIDSNIPRLLMKNKNGCYYEMSENNVNLVAVEDLFLKGGRQVIFETPAFTFANNMGGAGVAIWNFNEMVLNGKSFIVNAPCAGIYGHVEIPALLANHINTGSLSECGGIVGMASAGGFLGSITESIPGADDLTNAVTNGIGGTVSGGIGSIANSAAGSIAGSVGGAVSGMSAGGMNLGNIASQASGMAGNIQGSISGAVNSGMSAAGGYVSGLTRSIARSMYNEVPNQSVKEVKSKIGSIQTGIQAISPFGLHLGGTYKNAAINIANGATSLANNFPSMYGDIMPNRHCAAWENMLASVQSISQAISGICGDLVRIDSIIGYGNSAASILANAAEAVAHAEASYMEFNRGI